MPQNGIHAIVGIASRKWMPKKEWLLLGVVLGNMFPDLDNLVVAFANLALGQSAAEAGELYHRTFTHSIFTILVMVALFYVIAAITKNEKWKNFGIGFGIDDCFWNAFYTNDFLGFFRHELGNRTRSGV